MFLISPPAEQGEVMMKSSLSSGQVQLQSSVCILNSFRLTHTLYLWTYFVVKTQATLDQILFPLLCPSVPVSTKHSQAIMSYVDSPH